MSHDPHAPEIKVSPEAQAAHEAVDAWKQRLRVYATGLDPAPAELVSFGAEYTCNVALPLAVAEELVREMGETSVPITWDKETSTYGKVYRQLRDAVAIARRALATPERSSTVVDS